MGCLLHVYAFKGLVGSTRVCEPGTSLYEEEEKKKKKEGVVEVQPVFTSHRRPLLIRCHGPSPGWMYCIEPPVTHQHFKEEDQGAIHLAAYKKIVHLHMDEMGYVSQWRAIFAGGIAGIAAALATYPLEVAETRLIVQNCREPTYTGVLNTLGSVYRSEGLLALYRGFSLTVLGAFPFSIGCFAVYANLDKLWQEPPFRFNSLQNFINGCLAAGVAQSLSYPFDTVKRKMQAQSSHLPHLGGADVHFTGILDCFRQMIRNKGVFSLWSGFTANTVKIVPYFGLLYTCFETCKQVCLYRNGYIVSPLSYTLAPGVDQSLGPYELQEVKRYLKNRNFRSQDSFKNRW
ncbi:unnamed protein product [Gadus morhua 'NCC']